MKTAKQIAILFLGLGITGGGVGIYLVPEPHNVGTIMAAVFLLGVGVGVGVLASTTNTSFSGTVNNN